MRLASFILNNTNLILKAWSAFFDAKYPEVVSRATYSPQVSQRERILTFIAKDIGSNQTARQQKEKSEGRKSPSDGSSPGRIHGENRIGVGLGIRGIIAEYRALRASVIDLWMLSTPQLSKAEVTDLIRFNEAIDQAQTESVESYATGREHPLNVLESIMNSISDQAYLVNLDGRFIYVNHAVMQIHGISLKDAIGMNFFELNFTGAPTMQKRIQQVIDTEKQFSGEVSQRINGAEYFFEYLYVPVLSELGCMEAVAILARDITKRKLTEAESWHNANYDSLTDLPNRRMFLDKMAEEIKLFRRFPSRFALLFIDIDEFKVVNDELGHHVGDELLKQVATRIDYCVRETDLVARLGGDEFTVLLRSINDRDAAASIVAKIIHQLSLPFLIMDAEVNVSASIGVTFFPTDAKTPETLLNKADQAMYAAKNAGRNQFVMFDDVQK